MSELPFIMNQYWARGIKKQSLLLCLLLVGCSVIPHESTQVFLSHQELVADGEGSAVYLIRPRTERFMGFADNVLHIDLDGTPVADLVKGEYTKINIKPGEHVLSTRSKSVWGPNNAVKTRSQENTFNFSAESTRYILLQLVDGEFRGASFRPVDVSGYEAKKVTKGLRPKGVEPL